jgi:uncharacterized damage-inducible protein DinB
VKLLVCLIAAGVTALAAEAPAPSIAKIYDQQLSGLEREIVSLAEAMPADKFNFAPSGGALNGVRTFSQQMSHVAAAMYSISAGILGEKNPSETGKNENGPASLEGKDAVVKYLKDSFAYGHKAMLSLTDKNLTELVASPFGGNKIPRAYLATLLVSHGFDHYGQSVVYARMNGIVPPASR